MVIGYILLALSLAEFILGLYFIFRYEKQQSTFWYGLFCIGVAVYVGANGFGYVLISTSGDLTERFGWIGAAISTAFFLAFSYSFPLPRKKLSELLPLVIWPFVVFIPGFLWTDSFLNLHPTVHFRSGYQTLPGIFLWLFLFYFLVYWIWSIINLILRLRESDGFHRRMLRMVLVGVVTSLIASSVFDLTLPLITFSSFGYIGSLATSVWLGVTSYILVVKK